MGRCLFFFWLDLPWTHMSPVDQCLLVSLFGQGGHHSMFRIFVFLSFSSLSLFIASFMFSNAFSVQVSF